MYNNFLLSLFLKGFCLLNEKKPFLFRGKVVRCIPFTLLFFRLAPFHLYHGVGCWVSLGLSLHLLGIRVAVLAISYRSTHAMSTEFPFCIEEIRHTIYG